MQQRRVDGKTVALDTCLGRQIGHRLERADELGATIGIARIIERIHANPQVVRAACFGSPKQSDRNIVLRAGT